MDQTVSVTQARDQFAEMVNNVAFGKERFIVERRGKRLAAVVPIEDLELLDRLEDERDIKLAKKRLKEKGGISLEKLKRELGH